MTPSLLEAFNEHRDDRAAELFEIAEILSNEGLTPDAGPIQQAAGQCRGLIKTCDPTQPDAGRMYWGYQIAGLKVNLSEQRHSRPRRAEMKDATGSLSITVQEYIPTDATDVGQNYKLLRRLDTAFFMDVHVEIDGVRHPLRSCWHVDTHLHTKTQSHGVHPRFHYQVGGEDLDHLDELIRGTFMPEVPRMPCAPLDAILAIDFVLGQYCGDLWQMLPSVKPQYGRLRKKPMQRYWYPYFKALADGIDKLDDVIDGGGAAVLIPSIDCR